MSPQELGTHGSARASERPSEAGGGMSASQKGRRRPRGGGWHAWRRTARRWPRRGLNRAAWLVPAGEERQGPATWRCPRTPALCRQTARLRGAHPAPRAPLRMCQRPAEDRPGAALVLQFRITAPLSARTRSASGREGRGEADAVRTGKNGRGRRKRAPLGRRAVRKAGVRRGPHAQAGFPRGAPGPGVRPEGRREQAGRWEPGARVARSSPASP